VTVVIRSRHGIVARVADHPAAATWLEHHPIPATFFDVIDINDCHLSAVAVGSAPTDPPPSVRGADPSGASESETLPRNAEASRHRRVASDAPPDNAA